MHSEKDQGGRKALLRKMFCLTAQLAPWSTFVHRRVRVACLDGFSDLCQWRQKTGFLTPLRNNKNGRVNARFYYFFLFLMVVHTLAAPPITVKM